MFNEIEYWVISMFMVLSFLIIMNHFNFDMWRVGWLPMSLVIAKYTHMGGVYKWPYRDPQLWNKPICQVLGILQSLIFNHTKSPTLNSICLCNLLVCFSWLAYDFSKSLMARDFLSSRSFFFYANFLNNFSLSDLPHTPLVFSSLNHFLRQT